MWSQLMVKLKNISVSSLIDIIWNDTMNKGEHATALTQQWLGTYFYNKCLLMRWKSETAWNVRVNTLHPVLPRNVLLQICLLLIALTDKQYHQRHCLIHTSLRQGYWHMPCPWEFNTSTKFLLFWWWLCIIKPSFSCVDGNIPLCYQPAMNQVWASLKPSITSVCHMV